MIQAEKIMLNLNKKLKVLKVPRKVKKTTFRMIHFQQTNMNVPRKKSFILYLTHLKDFLQIKIRYCMSVHHRYDYCICTVILHLAKNRVDIICYVNTEKILLRLIYLIIETAICNLFPTIKPL